MEFGIFFKEGKDYIKRTVIPPSGSGWDFFKSLRLSVDRELENIRTDMLNIDENISLNFPLSLDKKKQIKICKLIVLRDNNKKIRKKLDKIMIDNEFVVCNICGEKMYKIPINVMYSKYENKYIVLDKSAKNIKFIYACEKCTNTINEECFNIILNNRKTREKLLKEGESWVPNDLGFWHWDFSVNNKHSKPDYFKDENDDTCEHAWRRTFEKFFIDNIHFLKIKEVCAYCGKINYST